jgi:hypothetical protein
MITRGIAIALVLVVAGRPAIADDNIAKADKLFDEGRALMNTDLHAACEKFEESLKFNSQAIGTLMNVALCDEKLGRTASAVAKFTEARDRARESGMDVHLKAAEDRLKELTPKVPHVTIKFTVAAQPETRIVIDDKVIALTAIADIAIDPGEHPLVVSAPDHLPYQTTVRIAEGEHRDITIPILEKSVTVRSSRRTIGKIVTISGGVALATGVILGLVARHNYNAEFEPPSPTTADPTPAAHCDRTTKLCTSDGQTETERARTLGNVGSVVGGIGIAAVAVGVYLWIRSPTETRDDRRVSLLPQLTPDGAGVVAVGRF